MTHVVRSLLSLCFCALLVASPVQAQEWWTGDNGSGSGSTSTTTSGDSDGTNSGMPEWAGGYTNNNGSGATGGESVSTTTNYDSWEEQIMKETAEDEENVQDALDRQAEEAIYETRGVTLDILNKPVELFKLTCTDNSKGGEEGSLTPTFNFTKSMWEQFCKDQQDSGAGSGGGFKQAGKCALDAYLQQEFQKVMKTINKFKDTNFCGAFTKLVSSQIEQCINIRFNPPRGQYPGFPALKQCMFGRLNINVDGNRLVRGQMKLADVVSYHGFKYKSVGKYSPTGFGGSEQQLLGSEGAAALMSVKSWQKAARAPTAGMNCKNVDQDLMNVLTEYPPVDMTLTPGNHGNKVYGYKLTPSGTTESIVAKWEIRVKDGSGSFDAYLMPGAGWSVKDGKTYLAGCYGFNLNVEDSTCAAPQMDSYKIMCTKATESSNCCNPEKTDCIGGDLIYPADVCGRYTRNADGSQVCAEWSHRKGEAMLCEKNDKGEPVCCNPNLNNCAKIGVDICPQFVPPKQCLTATPAQLALLDPAYSQLAKDGIRPEANAMVDGRVCCTSEWCNLCPQDVINAGAGRSPGGIVYMKTSEMANIPKRCRTMPRQQYDDRTLESNNAPLPTLLREIPDQVFANTEEACQMKTDGTHPAKIFDILVRCPQKNNRVDSIEIPGSMLIEKGIKWLSKNTDDCPNDGTLKPYSREVVESNTGCSLLSDATKYPKPLEKLPKVEGADTIGLCSDLPLCSAAIPESEDPYLGSGQLESAKSKGISGLINSILKRANGTLDGVPAAPRIGRSPNSIFGSGGRSSGSSTYNNLFNNTPRVINGSTTEPTRGGSNTSGDNPPSPRSTQGQTSGNNENPVTGEGSNGSGGKDIKDEVEQKSDSWL